MKFTRDRHQSRCPSGSSRGIAIDPANANHAFLSFSGVLGLHPGRPGHVFEVRFDPQIGKATSKDINGDLGDLPVTDLLCKTSNKTLYAATDFGVVAPPVGWVSGGPSEGQPAAGRG